MIQPNEHLQDIYRVAEHMDERSDYVRMDRNERVTPFGEDVFRDMLAALGPEDFCAYPNPAPLYRRLSHELGLPADHIYLTNGSDAAIRMTFQTYVRPGDRVVFPDPTYAMYAIYTRVFQAREQVIPYSEAMRLEVAEVFQWLKRRPRLLAIPNPDQPTGAVLPEATLRELAAAARDVGTAFLIDEAYYPFYPHTAVSLVRDFDNVVVTRTFSKVGGLAGLRLGYLVARPEIVHAVQHIRGAHEVNAVAIAVGSYVLDHPELGHAYLAEIEAGRQVLAAAAQDLGLGFPDCPTNFQLLRFHGQADTHGLVAALKGKGFLVKGGFSAPCVRDCIRITLAGPETMKGFVKALRAVAADLKVGA